MTAPAPVALIAEDEPVLARGLGRRLRRLWPSLHIAAVVHDGDAAVEAALAHLPDIAFLDIQMPGRTGLEAAEALIDEWPDERPLPLIVYVTAFDAYAIDAFQAAAIDYVLKPVALDRLSLTCSRLEQRLAERRVGTGPAPSHPPCLPASPPSPPWLTTIQAAAGATVHWIPLSQVDYFEAEDKYVRVVTGERTLLIRTPLRELVPRLDPEQFTQIHRGTVVRTGLIERVVREDTGKIWLHLRGRRERWAVSRTYAHLFRPM